MSKTPNALIELVLKYLKIDYLNISYHKTHLNTGFSMTDKDKKMYKMHKSFQNGYKLDDIEDIQIIEDRYNFIINPDYSVVRDPRGGNTWICTVCGEEKRKSYKDIVYNGMECSDCGNGSQEGIKDRIFTALRYACIECGEMHTFAILCGHHYAKAHRKDPNIIAHNYRRETRRMVLATGWKPKFPLDSGLFPCHLCKEDNVRKKMVKSHWEWHHSEIPQDDYAIEFLASMGVLRKDCTWCGKETPLNIHKTDFIRIHTKCKSVARKAKTQIKYGIRNLRGEPIDEDGNVVSEDELRFPNW